MNAKENKALAMAAVVVILLGQPAFARGGGFGGGFSGGTHGFGGFGVHGFGGGYTPSMHGGGEGAMGGNRPMAGANQERANTGDKPISNQSANDGNHQNNNNNNNSFDHDNDNNVTNNFDGNRGWAANHPYEAAGAADYASHHDYPYGGYNYAAYPYGYYGGVGVFPDFPLVIDNNTTAQQPQATAQPNNQSAPLIQQFIPAASQGLPGYTGYGAYNGSNPEQQAIMHERARVFAQELVGALGQRAPLAVAGQTNANGVNNSAASAAMPPQ